MSEKRYCELRAEGRILSGVGITYGDIAVLPFGRERFQAGQRSLVSQRRTSF